MTDFINNRDDLVDLIEDIGSRSSDPIKRQMLFNDEVIPRLDVVGDVSSTDRVTVLFNI